MKNIPAITTRYAGVNFRSRLEARWAAFFDLVNWDWEYEPLDLNGYIPDFILKFKEPLLFEIKPILHLNDFIKFVPKITESGWGKEFVIAGAMLFTNVSEHLSIGLIYQVIEPEMVFVGPDQAELFYCHWCGSHSIHGYDGWWACRKCLKYDGNQDIEYKDKEVEKLWKESGNIVQWNQE